jgi:hypothetical protein
VKRSASQDRAKFQAMKQERRMGQAPAKPTGKKLNVFAPIFEFYIIEVAGAFPNATVIVPKYFNVSGG